MGKKSFCYSVIIIVFSVFFIADLYPLPETIMMVTGEWPPYTAEGTSGQGFITELVTEAFAAADLKTEYRFYPWKRAEQTVLAGEAFAAFPYAPTAERRRKFDFSRPLTVSAHPPRLFYYRPNGEDYEYTDIKSLGNYRLVSYLGYFVADVLDENGIGYEITGTEEQAFRMLKGGRVDLFPNDPDSGRRIIEQLFPDETDNFAVLDKPFPGTRLHLMISRTYPDSELILKRFHEGLDQIMADGTYRRILEYHGMEEYAID